VDLCRSLGWLDGAWRTSPAASLDELAKFHCSGYLEALRGAEASGVTPIWDRQRYQIGGAENPIFPGLFERAATSVGGSILAARLALEGRVAYHPAGGTHHGRRDRASGFCYFNDPVFSILTCLESGLERVLYVDLDAHHGDGVEDAFAHDERVVTISVHESGRWPFTGRSDDHREGRAHNFAVPRHINDSEFSFLIDESLLPLARRFTPQAVIMTCGADCLHGDPLSTMDLSNGALWRAASAFSELAPAAVVLGGGGYNPWTVARAWTGLWGRLSGKAIPKELPGPARTLLRGLVCDLVDDEDIRPEWLTTLIDPPNLGGIRDEIRDMARQTLA
jgi:acetoin utilization protein AcuC